MSCRLGRSWNFFSINYHGKVLITMKTLVLIRYGEYQNRHLTPEGINQMTHSAKKLSIFSADKKLVVASHTPRASESGKIIAEILNTELVINDIFYSAEEDGLFPDNDRALEFIKNLNNDVDVLVAIASREYIETLPEHILNTSTKTSLERGECLILDCQTKKISYLRN